MYKKVITKKVKMSLEFFFIFFYLLVFTTKFDGKAKSDLKLWKKMTF